MQSLIFSRKHRPRKWQVADNVQLLLQQEIDVINPQRRELLEWPLHIQ